MNKGAYYNEFDPFAAAWLRELIKENLIAPGEVDERSIVDVRGDDLKGYSQHHFFAGIGGWSLALRYVGWPDDQSAWTGSCPCQPFSAAGKRQGEKDPRHLWPEFRRLIAECAPPVVFGEQVASTDGRLWLAGVRADLEALGHAVGAADLCAAGVGSPHIRQRLYWVADAQHAERWSLNLDREDGRHGPDGGREEAYSEPGARRQVRGLADDQGERRGEKGSGGERSAQRLGSDPAPALRLAQSNERERGIYLGEHPDQRTAWAPSDTLACSDGKTRRVESGTFPLAHGVPARVGRLRGYGNAIIPQVAAEFIGAFLEC